MNWCCKPCVMRMNWVQKLSPRKILVAKIIFKCICTKVKELDYKHSCLEHAITAIRKYIFHKSMLFYMRDTKLSITRSTYLCISRLVYRFRLKQNYVSYKLPQTSLQADHHTGPSHWPLLVTTPVWGTDHCSIPYRPEALTV